MSRALLVPIETFSESVSEQVSQSSKHMMIHKCFAYRANKLFPSSTLSYMRIHEFSRQFAHLRYSTFFLFGPARPLIDHAEKCFQSPFRLELSFADVSFQDLACRNGGSQGSKQEGAGCS